MHRERQRHWYGYDRPPPELRLVQPPGLALRLWHWRHVPLLGLGLPAAWLWSAVAVDPLLPVCVVLSASVSVCAVPELRRWGLARVRCVAVPHLVRRALQHGRVSAPDGRMPSIWWTSPAPYGVRVRLHCPLGMRPRLVAEAADLLCAACHADDAFVALEPRSRVVIVGLQYRHRGRWWER